jgi:hypothetical protein
MKNLARVIAVGLVIVLLPSLGRSQEASTDRSEMDQWIKDTAKQGDLPIGTKVTMANWQQYKNFMPLGMQKLFEGIYFWKMPPNVEMDVGPAIHNFLPKSWRVATEKYGSQTSVEVLPNGHYVLHNYHGGTPFPNPQEPNKGWKILANIFFAYVPSIYVNTPNNPGSVWSVDRYGNINLLTDDIVYRWSDYNTDPNFPQTLSYAPGTWYTEWAMEETPEQAKYTATLSLYYVDQEKNPYPDIFLFVPALRRSLRLSSTARCSPIFGLDWSYDDAKTNGFNGSTSTYTGDFLGDRKLLTLAHFDGEGGSFPDGYLMPLGFPKPSWGKWEVREHAVDDIHRISSEAAGYCYSSRIAYADREHWNSNWTDLFDSNHKLWKSISWYNRGSDNVPNIGPSWDTVSSAAMDFQNAHETIFSGLAKGKPYLGINAPKEFLDGVKYGSPSGMQEILR